MSLAEIQVFRSFVEELVIPFLRLFLSLEWFESFGTILESQRGAISIVNSFLFKKENTFFLGLLNSFFPFFPLSITCFFVCQKGEREAGSNKDGSGKTCSLKGRSAVLLWFRSLVVPYLALEPLNLLLFVGLLTSCFFKTVLGKEENRGLGKTGPFAFFLAFGWVEECCAFRYLGNVHLGPSFPLFFTLFKDQLYLFALRIPSWALSSLFLFSFIPSFLSKAGSLIVLLPFPYQGSTGRLAAAFLI